MEQRWNKFTIYPVVQIDGKWSVPDEVLVGIWAQIEAEGKVQHLMYDGTIRTPIDWVAFLHRPGTFPLLVVDPDQKTVVHIAWLKDLFDVGGWVHHCSVGRYQRGAWEAVRDHWRQYFTGVKLLLGLTPVTNEKAVKFLERICKFTIVGTVPQMCRMAYEGDKRVPAVLSYYEMEVL